MLLTTTEWSAGKQGIEKAHRKEHKQYMSGNEGHHPGSSLGFLYGAYVKTLVQWGGQGYMATAVPGTGDLLKGRLTTGHSHH
ncbi:hypothetical protein DdX_05904 [Ditylenchus destructor]|uniref:Uncharacterized protein n=1 Tax=Ditylenchus destructor TaxID=166010 RepID=A0AAD4R9B0_9BILA|nr:hypothetical protein DdX_05904 [Ditylenchus destructor]